MSDRLPARATVALVASDPALRERACTALVSGGWGVELADDAPEGAPQLLVLALAASGDVAAARDALAEPFARLPLVALLDGDPGAPAVRRAMRAGASGVVLAADLERALAPTVAAVAAGQAVLPSLAERQLARPALSVRERQVLSLVVMGLMNGEIAAQLFVAESTVKSHLSSAFAKLGVRSRNEAVELILDPDADAGLGILRIGGEPLGALAEAS
jgi:DNA-binding NarL/FixJ family response regulator